MKNKNNPKISIVTPSYNQGNYIEDAIKSVMEQNYNHFEHIIIDNCSTDNTIDILKRYTHLKWTSEPDKGQSDAINKGFKKATGDIIGWLNADDYYSPGTFRKVAEKLINIKIDGIYSNLTLVNKDKSFRKNLITHKSSKWYSLFYCYIPSATFFFKRKIIEEGIYIDPDFHIAMDKEFFAHILYSGFNLLYVNDYFASFRWHESNKSIDSPAVKRIRYKEGFTIFNRYSSLKLPFNNVSIFIYRMICAMLLGYRFFLKLGNKKLEQ